MTFHALNVYCMVCYQGHFCDEYAMQGMSAEANEIYLELCPENLLRALKTAQAARWIKLKLTNKHTPCLTLEVEQVKNVLKKLKAEKRT